jgi:hypothetical protein
LSEFEDILGGGDQASLEMHWQGIIKRVWVSTGNQSMDGALDAEALFISLLTRNLGNVTR